MNRINRDLLVLFNQELMTPQAIEQEVDMLHELLFDVERMDNLVTAHELIDLNKYKIINNVVIMKNTIRKQDLKPFQYIFVLEIHFVLTSFRITHCLFFTRINSPFNNQQHETI